MPAPQIRRPRARALTTTGNRSLIGWTIALVLLLLLGIATQARAQESFPRIGLSASKTSYVDNITVQFATDFELYAMVTGFNPGDPINQSISSMPWVIHQVCCGAVLEIQDMQWNPALQHIGHPLAGVISSVETCLDQDIIWLATITVRLVSQQAGDLLWAAGPFGPIRDCDGEVPFFMSMPVTIIQEGEPTPTDVSPWGDIKAMYR